MIAPTSSDQSDATKIWSGALISQATVSPTPIAVLAHTFAVLAGKGRPMFGIVCFMWCRADESGIREARHVRGSDADVVEDVGLAEKPRAERPPCASSESVQGHSPNAA